LICFVRMRVLLSRADIFFTPPPLERASFTLKNEKTFFSPPASQEFSSAHLADAFLQAPPSQPRFPFLTNHPSSPMKVPLPPRRDYCRANSPGCPFFSELPQMRQVRLFSCAAGKNLIFACAFSAERGKPLCEFAFER